MPALGTRIGVQRPSIEVVPDYVDNAYEEAIDLAKAYGIIPDEWQEYCLRATLGELNNGLWSSPRVALSVPRQNGKNGFVEVRELYGAVILGEKILHTAHEVKTAVHEHFPRMKEYFENNDDLRKMVKKISNVNGSEGIFLHNGGSIRFIARSKSSGRGFSIDTLVLDEAQELDDAKYSAIQFALSASKNPQQILTGTPPGPTVNGEVFERFRDDALSGKSIRLSWLEWSADKGADLDDIDAWHQSNPALGIRLGLEKISDERASTSDEEFARERLGMWNGAASNTVIDMDLWASLVSTKKISAPVAFAVDVSPNRDKASIGVAGYQDGYLVHVQVIDQRNGTGWVVDALSQLKEKWEPVAIVIDKGSPAATLMPDLKAAHIRVMETDASDMAQACGNFYDLVQQERLRHADQPGLNTALASATKRTLRDAFAWNRKNTDADITPLVAVSLAAFGLTTKRNPRKVGEKKQQRVIVLS